MTHRLDSIRPLFVYGTLLPEQPNFHVWGRAIEQIVPARIEGYRLYDLGAYPMMVAEPGHSVRGKLVFVVPSEFMRIIERLDALEGYVPDDPEACAYRRVLRPVWANRRCHDAWVYQGRARFVRQAKTVPNGDWHAYSVSKKSEISNWWATIETVAGLHEVKED